MVEEYLWASRTQLPAVYDGDGALDLYTSPESRQTDYVYVDGRLDHIDTPEGTTSFAYEDDKVKTISRNGESVTYSYDGRLGVGQAFSGTLNKSIAIGYNAGFQVSSVTYAGTTDEFAYDDDGLVIGIGEFEIDRNNPSNPSQPNASGQVEFVTDGNLRLTPHVTPYGEVDGLEYKVNSTVVADFGLAINDLGQITAKVEVVDGEIQRRQRLGGVLSYYYREAA